MGGGKYPIKFRLWIAKGNIAGDRLVKHVIILKNDSDVPPNVAVIEAFQIDIVEKYGAFRRLQKAGNQFDQRRFAAAAPAHECHHPPWDQIERDIFQDVRRFGSAVFKADSAQFNMPFETMNWNQPGAIMTLLWFLLENIVQTIQEDSGLLHVVPHSECAHNPCVGHRGE